MATGSVLLSVAAAAPPDGSASNAAPAILRVQGTEANPKKHYLTAAFDASTDEHLWWTFRMPADYASGGALKIQATANATTGNAIIGGRLGAVTPADADTPIEHAAAAVTTGTWAANATEARRLVELSITLANLDSVAAGDLVFVLIYRDADNGSDTLSVDWELISATFEYTTS